MDALIGIDAGTTTIEVVAYAPSGEWLARHRTETPVDRPSSGLIEVDMTRTWERTASAIRSVVDDLDDEATVVGVGVVGQGDGLWPLDIDGTPVGKAILWNDGRAAGMVRELETSGIAERIRRTTGARLFAGSSLPIALFLAENNPDRFDRIATILWCKDWIKYRLTGEFVTDPSDASVYLDSAGEIADAAGEVLPGIERYLPWVAPGPEVIGRITPEATAQTELPEGTPVVSGTIDAVASTFGSGAVTPGDRATILGTTALHGVVLDGRPDDLPSAGSTIPTGVGERWTYAMGSMAGTPNLDWARNTIADGERFDEIETAADSASVGCDGLLYLPFLSDAGERAPFRNVSARAAFLGLSSGHRRRDLLRAVYEGVALAARDCYERAPGSGLVRLSGGGARSGLWPRIVADCLDAEVAVVPGAAGARGAALLAGIGTDRYADLDDAVVRGAPVERVEAPDPGNARAYDVWYEHYLATYEALFEIWERRADAVDQMRSFAMGGRSE